MNTREMRIPSNRVRDIERYMHAELDTLYGEGEVGVFVGMLFEAFLGWDKAHFLLHRGETIDQSDLLRFHWAVEDLKKYRPIQHIIGYTDFCGCRIAVGPDVLIPRPETEEMILKIIASPPSPLRTERGVVGVVSPSTPLSIWRGVGGEAILDLCTGSGCIAIALKKAFPQACVTAVDVSEKALAVARCNAEANGTDITFIQADILDPKNIESQYSTFDLIVSNPPYVRDSERTQIAANVLDYDPALALFVPDDDPLRFYRAIADIASRSLAPDGLLAVEINEALADETCTLLRGRGFDPITNTDFRNRPRWITATHK